MFQASVSNTLILVWLFVYCFYGHLISFKCTQVGEFAYHSKFYQYPIELKWFTIFMIARSQRPFFITGYRITKCSLESYSRVSKISFSVFDSVFLVAPILVIFLIYSYLYLSKIQNTIYFSVTPS